MIRSAISRDAFSQFKKFFQYGIGNVFAILIPVVVAKRVLDICGEDHFGKISIAVSIFFILSIFIEFGSFVSPLKNVSVNRKNLPELCRIFSVVFYSRILLFFVALLLLFLLLFCVPYLRENFVLYLFCITIFVGQILSPLYFFQGLEDFKNTALFTALSKILYVLLVLVFINKESDFVYVNFLLGLSNVLIFLAAIVFLFKKHHIRFVSVTQNDLFNYIKADAHLLINSFSLVSVTYVPIIFIGLIAGEFWAGIYKVLDIFVTLLRNYLLLFFNSIFPRTCLLLSESHEKGSRFILRFSILSTLFLLVIIAVSILLKSYFLAYFLKGNGNLIAPYFNWVVIPVIIASMNTPFLQVLFYYNKKTYYSGAYLIVAVVNVVINYILISHYQIKGLIGALVITEFLLTSLFIISTEIILKEIAVIKRA